MRDGKTNILKTAEYLYKARGEYEECFFAGFLIVSVFRSQFTAKHHCLSQPGGPQWLALPVGGHGGTSVHAALGEGGTHGRHGGTQRPTRGAARRGPLTLLFFMLLRAFHKHNITFLS